MPNVLILPGLYNSGPEHWQSHWERQYGYARIVHDDWERPTLAAWIARLDEAMVEHGANTTLVAHSSSCILVAAWSALPNRVAHSALLVAPSDAEAASYPHGPTGFAPVPRNRIPFPTMVVASSDDPYVSIHRAAQFAQDWGSRFVNVGARDHIGSASGVGAWAEGHALLMELLAIPDN